MSEVFAVILAGGSGSRFWPASRRLRPKQLQSLGPGDGALIRQALERLKPLSPLDQIYVSTGQHLVQATQEALPELPPASFLAEPAAKNTAPCIGWATERIARINEDAIVIVLPSDQYVAKPEQFENALRKAVEVAAAGAVVTLGISPTRPETGYGYLHAGAELGPDVFELSEFREKPDRKTAEEYLAKGGYFWNAGIFVFPAKMMLEQFRSCLPKIHAGLMRIREAASEGAEAEQRAVEEFFAGAEGISIDFGVMEKIGARGLVRMVAADVGWSDLGSFQTAWELADKDATGNCLEGVVLTTGCRNNLVLDMAKGAPAVIAMVGVEDLVVVRTNDAVLVAKRQQCQDVKHIVEMLREAGRDDLL